MALNRSFRRWFAVVVFFTVLAGDALRYSLTWYGWAAVILAIGAISVVLLAKTRDRWRFNGFPYPMVAFVLLAFLSTAWSDYPGWTALGALTTLMTMTGAAALAIALTWDDLVWALGTALRFVLGLSLLFEFVIAVFVRQPILPWWTDYGTGKIHAAYYWSRDLLFTGERIQGIMGNSNLLGFVALLGIIVFVLQLSARTVRLGWGILWLAVAVADVVLTRSATVTVAIVVVAIVAAVLLLIRSRRTAGGRAAVYVGSIVVVALGAVGAFVFSDRILALLNKSDTLTGRTGIWNLVISWASQRPVGGWGWISYWVPFIPPFKGHAVLSGVQYLQAHEAWLDIWFQLGVLGLIVFGALVLSTVVRTWILAVDRDAVEEGARGPFSARTLLPILILAALLAQSLAESRLLLEYGMLLLCLFSIRSKRDLSGPSAP